MTELPLARGSSYSLKRYRYDNRQMRELGQIRAIRPEKPSPLLHFKFSQSRAHLKRRKAMQIAIH